ncbi:MAG TPA: MBL fold metallo-hydrolase [Candidatus Bathyarchaeia archaeon]|nr:MBL fold metallo-hydrolase [Candidatus Bathyarchaeia archaeon]
MELEIVRGSGLCSNCFILGDLINKKLLIIDLGLPGKITNFRLKKALKEITKNKLEEYQIEVFLTHAHLDHIKGEDNLDKLPNVVFCASEYTAGHINSRDGVTLLSKFHFNISYNVEKIYSDNQIINFSDTTLRVISAPGHTDGSTVLYDEKNKALFAGDVVFSGGGCGRVDLPSGNRKSMIDSLEKLTKLNIEHLYSGHGPDLHGNVRENILLAKQLMESW